MGHETRINSRVGLMAAKAVIAAVFAAVIFVLAGPTLWFIATVVLYNMGMGRIAEPLGGIASAAISFVAAYLIVTIIMRRYIKISA